ncbi:MAG: DUF4625 domain-containing protein [Carboxylicivirga sp.]|jgi:ABC-type phosphate/phosphonate transport system substrate-binding protein|nr:DUF4625 domain-containing protein [Carboxylicivirga sp.]
MKNLRLLLLFCIAACLFSACTISKRDVEPISAEDREAPRIDLKSPVNEEVYKRATELPLSATFSDDVGLKQCTVTIEYQQKTNAALKGLRSPWTPSPDVISLDKATEKEISTSLFDVAIKASCKPGQYRLKLVLEDLVGKTTEETVMISIK